MREWLGKPLLILLAIVLVLAAMSAAWLWSSPQPAGASSMVQGSHNSQLERAMRDFDMQR